MLAIIVNDNAFDLVKRGALDSIASKLAPTVTAYSGGLTAYPVGASLLAMDVNDNAFHLAERGALESIASKLAPTVTGVSRNGK